MIVKRGLISVEFFFAGIAKWWNWEGTVRYRRTWANTAVHLRMVRVSWVLEHECVGSLGSVICLVFPQFAKLIIFIIIVVILVHQQIISQIGVRVIQINHAGVVIFDILTTLSQSLGSPISRLDVELSILWWFLDVMIRTQVDQVEPGGVAPSFDFWSFDDERWESARREPMGEDSLIDYPLMTVFHEGRRRGLTVLADKRELSQLLNWHQQLDQTWILLSPHIAVLGGFLARHRVRASFIP